jgi:hypothetical protein
MLSLKFEKIEIHVWRELTVVGMRNCCWGVMVLNAIFQLYRGGQFYWWRKARYPKKTIDLPPIT